MTVAKISLLCTLNIINVIREQVHYEKHYSYYSFTAFTIFLINYKSAQQLIRNDGFRQENWFYTNFFFVSSYNYSVKARPGQNVWNKIEKSSKTEQDKKSLIYTFACFLTASAKV